MSDKFSATQACPCQSGLNYQDCCSPFHLSQKQPHNAEQLMRSRYCAYALKNLDYIQQTTVPSQQALLNMPFLQEWADNTKWQGLQIKQHKSLSSRHSLVEFVAFYQADQQTVQGQQTHHEYSLFVQINQAWYFVDPTVALPTMKQPCICGSNKKFKHCCGAFL